MYAFYPDYKIERKNTCFVESSKGFTKKEIEDIKKLCENLELESGVLVGKNGQPVIDNSYRNCNVSWLEFSETSEWLYDKISYMVKKVNTEYFNYDLFGFLEPFQYTVYDEKTSGHYDWHIDRSDGSDGGNSALAARKLSISIQLSDENEYDGGELEIKDYSKGSIISKELGTMVFFPSFVLHRVNPIVRGTRKSLVIWVAGPPFR